MTTIDDNLLEQRDALPTTCPPWCRGEHERMLYEGVRFDEAALHHGPMLEQNFRDLAGTWMATRIELTAQPCQTWWGDQRIRLEVDLHGGHSAMVGLTTGHARVLARQLLHLADLADLEE